MRTVVLFICLLAVVSASDLIIEKSDHEIIDSDDDYWYAKVTRTVNRPAFPAYIRFINKHTAKSEYAIDCSVSSQILYYNGPPQIIFRTTGHTWSVGDSYFVTVDEGVFYSSADKNSTAFKDPTFWKFHVIRPVVQPEYL